MKGSRGPAGIDFDHPTTTGIQALAIDGDKSEQLMDRFRTLRSCSGLGRRSEGREADETGAEFGQYDRARVPESTKTFKQTSLAKST